MKCFLILVTLVILGCVHTSTGSNQKSIANDGCGELHQFRAQDHTYKYSFTQAQPSSRPAPTVILLVGGGGNLDLDEHGCPGYLIRNPLVRIVSKLNQAGVHTALLDAPNDFQGEFGLAGYRSVQNHAIEISMLIAELRQKTKGPIWLAGHSRGTLSALNVAARISGNAAPNGIILASPMVVGGPGIKKPWASDTIFDFQLEKVAVPTLLLGHKDDACEYSPAEKLPAVAARLGTTKKTVQILTTPAGTNYKNAADLCGPNGPHGFAQQDQALVDAIIKFIFANS